MGMDRLLWDVGAALSQVPEIVSFRQILRNANAALHGNFPHMNADALELRSVDLRADGYGRLAYHATATPAVLEQLDRYMQGRLGATVIDYDRHGIREKHFHFTTSEGIEVLVDISPRT